MSSKKRIAVIPGDGIGKRSFLTAVQALTAARADLETSHFDWGADRYLADGMTVPPDGFAMLDRDFDAILLGAFGDPRVSTNIHAKEILLGMRFKMDLYANVRPVRLLDASLCPLKGVEPKDVDFVVIRENTEGVYGDAGGVFKQGTPTKSLFKKTSIPAKASSALFATPSNIARRHTKLDGSPRNRVLMCDKSNAMTHAGGLWQRVFKEVAREYPQIKAAAHVRGRALHADGARSTAIRRDRDQQHVWRHHYRSGGRTCRAGSAWPPAAIFIRARLRCLSRCTDPRRRLPGRIMANPFGAILTAAMMLAHLGMSAEAARIEAAVLEAVREKKTTADIGGDLGTREAGEWVAKRIARS